MEGGIYMRASEKRKNNIIIGVLLGVVVLMGIAYAAFASNLNITGTSSMSENWCIGFDSTRTSDYTAQAGIQGGTTPTGSMSFSGDSCGGNLKTTASLNASFKQPGDKVEYTLTIGNKGTLAAAIESIDVDGDSVTSDTTITKGNIKYTVEMPQSTTLAVDAETTMKVTAEFQNDTDINNYTTGETQTISVQINAQQDDGNGGMDITPAEQYVYAINASPITQNTSTLQDIGTTYNSCSATGKNVCLKYTIEDDKVIGADVCFMKGGSESCLKGWVDECQYDVNTKNCSFTGTKTVFNSNKAVLQSAFTEENVCTDAISGFWCFVSNLSATVDSQGNVCSMDGSWTCQMYSSGDAHCFVDMGD